MNLLKVDTVNEAKQKLIDCCKAMMPQTEMKGLHEAAGEILAQDVYSTENIPPYRRSIMDGYAVRSRDLGAAGDMIPTVLRVKGEVILGEDASGLCVEPGCCVYVPTGGYVPEGSDAVVMIEYCEAFGSDMLAVSKSAAPGENIVSVGEDVSEGEMLLPKGRKIRPQDTGVLAACGISEVPVFVPWKVTVISTGDELVSPDQKPGPGRIRDINTYTISARSTEEGFDVVRRVHVKDDRAALLKVITEAKEDSDLVVISGGSSQGKKDMTADIISEAADHGVMTHGIAAKPGKPTITGYDGVSRTLFIGLPGHPAAALMVYEQVLIDTWRTLICREKERTLYASVSVNVPSAPGRMTFQPVKLKGSCSPEAVPVFARSGMISPLSYSDGYFIMSENQEGIRPGDTVEVHLWK